MFTGIVEKLATVISTRHLKGRTYSLQIDLGRMTRGVRIGDSIAVNGVCLTVIGKKGTTRSFEVIKETLSRTNLGILQPGSKSQHRAKYDTKRQNLRTPRHGARRWNWKDLQRRAAE